MRYPKHVPAKQERPAPARPNPEVIAPKRGWPGPAAGRAGHVERGHRYLGTTTQLAGLYPWMQASGLPAEGVPLGPNLFTRQMTAIDPAGWVGRLTTNPGIWIQGQPGVGKSAVAKRLCMGYASYGYQLMVPGDVKGEYVSLVEHLGGQVVRIGRGLDKINPLDSGPLGRHMHRLSSADQTRLRSEITGRRLEFLNGLLASPYGLGRRPNALESGVLSQALRVVADRSTVDPTIPDLVTLLRNPPQEVRDRIMVHDQEQYVSMSRELIAAVTNLCDGPLSGLFDGPTTTPLDLDSPAVAVDLRNLLTAGDQVVATGLLATWSYSYAAVDTARAFGAADRPLILPLDEMWRALRAGPGMVGALDSMTRLNRSKGEISIMITHSLRDLEALPTEEDRAKAAGLMERCDTLLLAAMSQAELKLVSAQRQLTDRERELVASWASPGSTGADNPHLLHPGRGKYLARIGAGELIGDAFQLQLSPLELELYNTDTAMLRSGREQR